jgi:starch synthase
MKRLSIVQVTSEVTSFAKTGGLADVTRALSTHLHDLGHLVVVIMPYHGAVKRLNLPLEVVGESWVHLGDRKFGVKFRRGLLDDKVPIYFVSNDDLFGRHSKLYGYPDDNLRFFVFNLGVIELLKSQGITPDLLHCHDWHSALLPNLLKESEEFRARFADTATLVTIHNLPFQMQGDWWNVPEGARDSGKGWPTTDPETIPHINFMKRGIRYADAVSTVSERYAQEILTPEYGQGLDPLLTKRKEDVFGIVNGIDYAVENPNFDPYIWQKYDWNSLDGKLRNKTMLQKQLGLAQDLTIPMLGAVSRLSEQKGFDLLMELTPMLLKLPIQLVIVGSGHKEYVKFFREVAKKHSDRVAISSPFTPEMEYRVYAGSDMFLMPSRYEPCGISQMKSLRYGSIPIVHETGGLSDTIEDFDPRTGNGNGFVFHTYHHEDFLVAIVRALETYKYPQTWEHLTWQAMRKSYSWELPAKKYVDLYRTTIRRFQERKGTR